MNAKLAIFSVLVAGWVSAAQAAFTTYQGPLVETRLENLSFILESGRKVPLPDALPGYTPDSSFLKLRLPISRHWFDIGMVPKAAYRDVFRSYDANGNDMLERPEMAVMYAVEAARGLGHPAVGLGASDPVPALSAPREDVSGLLRYINANKSRMNGFAQALFRDMPWLIEFLRSSQEGGRGPFD